MFACSWWKSNPGVCLFPVFGEGTDATLVETNQQSFSVHEPTSFFILQRGFNSFYIHSFYPLESIDVKSFICLSFLYPSPPYVPSYRWLYRTFNWNIKWSPCNDVLDHGVFDVTLSLSPKVLMVLIKIFSHDLRIKLLVSIRITIFNERGILSFPKYWL